MRLRSIFVATLCCGFGLTAHADSFNFSFGSTSSVFSGAGTLTTGTLLAPGEFLITAVSGSARDTSGGQSSTITSILAPGTFPTPANGNSFPASDNTLFVFNGVGTLSQNGVSFLLADGSEINLYNGGTGLNAFLLQSNGARTFEIAPAIINTTAATPEPTSIVFFGLGLFGLGFLNRRQTS